MTYIVTVRENAVVLIDEDITRDKRVLASLTAYPKTEIIDCANEESSANVFEWSAYTQAGIFLLRAVLRGTGIWSFLSRQHNLQVKDLSAGLRVSVRSFMRAHRVAAHLRSSLRGVKLIHAHDLFCGLIGAEISRMTGAALIYDAHEIEFHRNRKNSWLRTAFDATAEKYVVDRACEVRVVNAPIASLYKRIHRIAPEKIRVVPNNHFTIRSNDELTAVPCAKQLAFVYVGGGVRGRQLDMLAAEAARLGVPVHAFFIGEVPELAIVNSWVIGARDYEAELVALVASHRCVMWCCVDDVCLSYRLSLPNKFFQAVAVGIPIVASVGTYLADLADAHQIGFVFDGCNLDKMVQEMQGADFADKRRKVHDFRVALTVGSVKV